MHVEKPPPEGESTLLYPFDPRVAWVAACYHRTSSRISWDLCSSNAVRLEPLFDDLLPALVSDERLPRSKVRFSVEVGAASDFEASPLQLRGVVKNTIVEAFTSHAIAAELGLPIHRILCLSYAERARQRCVARSLESISEAGLGIVEAHGQRWDPPRYVRRWLRS